MKVSEFSKIDTTFNEAMFLSKVNNIFIQLFNSLMFDELKDVDHFICDELYKKYNELINEHKLNNIRQVYDELHVKYTKIENIEVTDDKYIITVYLESRYLDYCVDLNSKDVVSGNDYRPILVNYRLMFEKDSDAKKQGIIRECSSCGASMDINDSGVCPYCNSVYKQEYYDWVLTSIEEI